MEPTQGTLSQLEATWNHLQTADVYDWWVDASVRSRIWLCGRYYPRAGFNALLRAYRFYDFTDRTVEDGLAALADRKRVDPNVNWAAVANDHYVSRSYFEGRCAAAIDYFERVRTYSGMYATIAHAQEFAARVLEYEEDREMRDLILPVTFLRTAMDARP